jgi:hypothetical protein
VHLTARGHNAPVWALACFEHTLYSAGSDQLIKVPSPLKPLSPMSRPLPSGADAQAWDMTNFACMQTVAGHSGKDLNGAPITI